MLHLIPMKNQHVAQIHFILFAPLIVIGIYHGKIKNAQFRN